MQSSIARIIPLICLSAGVLLTSCEPPATGVCEGKIDGDVFNLVVYNCIDQDIYVEYNLRNVGKVDPIDKDKVCGVTYVGELPQCSSGEITFDGYQLYSSRLVWSESLMQQNSNGCWVSVILDQKIGEEPITNYVLPSPPEEMPDQVNGCLPLNLEDPLDTY